MVETRKARKAAAAAASGAAPSMGGKNTKGPKNLRFEDLQKMGATPALGGVGALNVTVGNLRDSGIMFLVPLLYGWSVGMDPLRLVIGFALQCSAFLILNFFLFNPLFFKGHWWYAWDLQYRRTINEKFKDENAWASSFHLVVALSTVEYPFIGLPVIAAVSYYALWVDRTGLYDDFQGIIKAIQDSLTPERIPEDETMEQTEAREMRMIMKTLDSTLAVGAPLCAGENT
ncbi:hypothetical protein HDV05_002490 [Chytridiales sp. JEL 0842]|nr:hypothetical protein HDV05_002490 [Chytridiales sp. JEL 0842]